VSWAGSTEIESSLIAGWSAVRSCTVRILALVTGHTVSQRVKMKLTMVTWPRSESSVSASPR
jgi:hypothetical protein